MRSVSRGTGVPIGLLAGLDLDETPTAPVGGAIG